MKYASVAVFSIIDALLTYAVPENLSVVKGCRVMVPLGQKLITGIVIDANLKNAGIDTNRIKPIERVVDEQPVISDELIKLGLWLAQYYISPPGIVFSAMLAALLKVKSKKMIRLRADFTGAAKLEGNEKLLYDFLYKRRGKKADIRDAQSILNLKNIYKITESLEEKGALRSEFSAKVKEKRQPSKAPDSGAAEIETHKELTAEQKHALSKINSAIDAKKFAPFLVFGVTGSGKTEVYIKAAEHAVKQGKKVIVLVPEIFLTPQIMERFKRAFGERVAVYHSGLEEGERLHEWLKIKNNGADVVVGTRSSVFAPFDNTGLLIVDEEFDSSYKQESEPRYNGRDVAVYRAKMNNAVVILGSATPSAESYHNAVIGKYEMIKLEKRVHGRPMPDIKVVDMKADWQHGQELFLSDLLMDPMKETLKAGEQSILFMNRRGFSSFIFCKKCGHIEKCDNCDIPLVFHKEGNDMRCHYCDLSIKPSVYCPKCKNKLSFSGTGTQKIEEVITKFFPDKRIKRVDMDTMGGKNEYFEVYRQIKEKEIDILIGTQMIAKGFDFPEVTFVGVVGIDSVLNLPDFRAEERVFQLLTQVAGRTGRGDKNGIVAIQTYNPDAVGIKYVKKYEIEKFYQEQLSIRKDMNYPPYTGIIQFICKDEDHDKAEKTGDKLRAAIDEAIEINKISGIEVLGPCDAPLSRIRNKYRISILIKGKSRNDLNFIAREARKKLKGADVTIIVDPASTL